MGAASQQRARPAGPVVPQLTLPGSTPAAVRAGSPPHRAAAATNSLVPPLQLQPGAVQQPLVGHRTSSSPIPERPGMARVPPPAMTFNGAIVSPRPYAAQPSVVGPVVSRMHPTSAGATSVRMGVTQSPGRQVQPRGAPLRHYPI